jgi:hypothetical protein
MMAASASSRVFFRTGRIAELRTFTGTSLRGPDGPGGDLVPGPGPRIS